MIRKKCNDLVLTCYKNKDKLDAPEDIKKRGIITHAKNNRVLCGSVQGSMDYEAFKHNNPDAHRIIVEESIDGTLVNMFYHNHSWQLSTKRTPNAFHSYWLSSKSFGHIFMETIERSLDVSLLNKNNSYSFVLQHPECRNVSPVQMGVVYHIATYDCTLHKYIQCNIGTLKPYIYSCFYSYDSIEHFVNDLPFYREGVVLYSKDRQEHCKLKGKRFMFVKSVKGNVPCKEETCLRAYRNKQIHTFLYYFPEFQSIWMKLHKTMSRTIHMLHSLYVSKKIKKENVSTSSKCKQILYDIHGIYLKTRKRIKKETIYNYLLDTYSSAHLIELFHEFSKFVV